MIRFFYEPLLDGWVYPCTVEEISSQIERVPTHYIEGITAVGLCRSTNRDSSAEARYFYGREACIRMYSCRDTLSLRLLPYTKRRNAEQRLDRELEYGMKIESAGSRLICQWQPEDLKRFMLGHVLLHEIGHHVYYKERVVQGLHFQPVTTESEKFAEAFARRYKRNEK